MDGPCLEGYVASASSESEDDAYTVSDASTLEEDFNQYSWDSMERLHGKKPRCGVFSLVDKTQAFNIWISMFEEEMKLDVIPYSEEIHWKLCLECLPLTLDSKAFAIWRKSSYARTNWPKLKAELEEAFEDPEARAEWDSNMKAFMWDEIQPLSLFCAQVEQYVDAYEKELADVPEAKKTQCYRRFVCGLPDDYADYISLHMPSKCVDIEVALELCQRFQRFKHRSSNPVGDPSTVGGPPQIGYPNPARSQ